MGTLYPNPVQWATVPVYGVFIQPCKSKAFGYWLGMEDITMSIYTKLLHDGIDIETAAAQMSCDDTVATLSDKLEAHGATKAIQLAIYLLKK